MNISKNTVNEGYVSEQDIKTNIVVTKEDFVAVMRYVTVPKIGYLDRLAVVVVDLLKEGKATESAELIKGFHLFDGELRTLPHWDWVYRFKAALNTYRPEDRWAEETAFMRLDWLTEEQQKALHSLFRGVDNLPFQEMALDALTNDQWEHRDTAVAVARITNNIVTLMAKAGMSDADV